MFILIIEEEKNIIKSGENAAGFSTVEEIPCNANIEEEKGGNRKDHESEFSFSSSNQPEQ